MFFLGGGGSQIESIELVVFSKEEFLIDLPVS